MDDAIFNLQEEVIKFFGSADKLKVIPIGIVISNKHDIAIEDGLNKKIRLNIVTTKNGEKFRKSMDWYEKVRNSYSNVRWDLINKIYTIEFIESDHVVKEIYCEDTYGKNCYPNICVVTTSPFYKDKYTFYFESTPSNKYYRKDTDTWFIDGKELDGAKDWTKEQVLNYKIIK